MELVSIIVPVYNVAPYLARCVDSLLGQTYPHVEILLAENGSEDGSREIIEQYVRQDSRVRGLYLETNEGVSAARNRALEAAAGAWICFCDGDDWYRADYLEKMLACAQAEQADYIVCNYQIVSDYAAPVVSGSVSGIWTGCDKKQVIACGPTSSCTHMIRRELYTLSGVQYPVGVRQYEELPVVPVLAKYASAIAVVDLPLYHYYQRGNGTSASNMAVQSEKNFRIAWQAMRERLGGEYRQEAEFHAIYALLYGEILKLCKQKVPAKNIRRKISEFEAEFPAYRANPYLVQMGSAKRVFLHLVKLRWIAGLRLLAWMHGKIVK